MQRRPTLDIEASSLAALRRITRATEIYSRSLLREHRLTGPQLSVLQIAARLGKAPIGVLARATFIGSPTVTGIVDRLEGQGLVTRLRTRADRRQVYVAITAAGRRALSANPSPLHSRFRSQLSRLPKGKQRQICEALESVASMMEESPNSPRNQSC
jgi:DNA-binding MarR family transcriptional regulator